MRTALFTLALLLAALVRGECAGPRMYALPGGKTLAQGQVLFIEGYAVDHAKFVAHMRRNKAYLLSGDERVALRFIKAHEGMFQLSQAMFLPAVPLQEGRTYTLHVEYLSADLPAPSRWDHELNKEVPISWTVVEANEYDHVTVADTANVEKTTMVEYGCGPEMFVHVRVAETSPETAFCEVELRGSDGSRKGSYVLPLEQGVARIGHDMCSGAFAFDEGEACEARISVLLPDGRSMDGSTRTVRFLAPISEIRDR
jgi:hypothetical protein